MVLKIEILKDEIASIWKDTELKFDKNLIETNNHRKGTEWKIKEKNKTTWDRKQNSKRWNFH